MAELPLPREPCPGESVLHRFVEELLPPDEDDRVDRHVSDCPACQEALDGLQREPPGGVGLLLAARADDVPPRLDGYEVLGQLGKGGMGVVWRVHDLEFDRQVALKVMQVRLGGVPDLERRFLNEAVICARLAHRFIVPVHTKGALADGRPYYVMKLVGGLSLADRLQGEPPDPDRLAEGVRVFRDVCEALAYAHDESVIHRDLKPANIMVGAQGEVQVMDWGLAKALTVDADPPGPQQADPAADTLQDVLALTRNDSPVGTSDYMSPEQANGQVKLMDRRTDVFGLGAILCEILTGRPPYTDPDRDALLAQAKAADLADTLARLDACGADPELIGLAKRCLARREDRPADAGRVLAEVSAYLSARDERRQEARLERERRAVKAQERRERRKLWAALAAVAGAAVGLAILASLPRPSPVGAPAGPSQDPNTLRVGICPWPGGAPFKIAEKHNLCEGVKLEVVEVGLFTDARGMLNRQEIHAATCSLDCLINTCAGDKPGDVTVKVVLKLDESDGVDGIVVRRPVRTLAELKGMKIAIPHNEAPYYMLLELCHKEDLAPRDFNLENCEFPKDAWEKFRDDSTIDAVATYQPFLQLAEEEAKKVGGGLFRNSTHISPKITDVLVVDSRYLQDHRANVKALIRGWYRAQLRLKRRDDEARSIAKAFLREDSDKKYDLQADGLKLADLDDNRRFFQEADTNGFHQVTRHVDMIWRKFHPVTRPVNLAAFNGAGLFLDMLREGEFDRLEP